MADPVLRELEPHHEVEELLPWYATGQLGADERGLVEDHLSSCAHCRRQLGFERRMIDHCANVTPEIDAGWARLRERLESQQPRKWRGVWPSSIARDAGALWRTFATLPVAAIAVAQLSFVILSAALLLSLSKPSYRALGSAPSSQSANAVVMFRADTSESQLSQLLRVNGVSLVGGPTTTDAYLLRVPPSSRSAVLAHLRMDRRVIMAEPIDRANS